MSKMSVLKSASKTSGFRKSYGFHEARQELNYMNATYIPKKKQENWFLCLEHLRHVAMVLVLTTICDNLKIIRCNVKTVSKNVEPPHSLFSWALDDFLERVKIPDNDYITEFQQKYKKTADFVKLQKDIESIIDLLTTLIADVTHREDLTRFENKTGTVMKFIKLQMSIFSEKETNEGLLKMLKFKLKNFPKQEEERFREWELLTKDLREQWQDDRLILYPLKLRYVTSWGNAQVSQLEKDRAVAHESYLSRIRENKIKFLREQECFSNIQEAYEGEISNLYKKIQKWQETYDKEYELRDFELTRTRAELDVVLTSLIKHQTQYENYNKKIAKRLAQLEAEEADREWRRQIEMAAFNQEAEAAAAAAAAAKKGKKDKKKKGKGKKK